MNTHDTRPNIVLILIDDLGWKDLGCTGSGYYQTPHIDQLAADGMLFTRAYAAAPICSPSRGALYSGQYPARTKFTAVIRPYVEPDAGLHEMSKPMRGNYQHHESLHRHCLPPDVPTIAQMLGSNYRTGFVGKWHCGWNQAHWPDKRGWDVAEGFRTIPAATRGHFGRDFVENQCMGLDDLGDDQYMTDVLTDRAEAFIAESANQDRPFFLTLSHYAVHTPLDAPEELVEKYRNLPTTDHDNPVYAAMIEKVDDSVGRIMHTLRDHGIEEDTMVIFTSDNGGLSPRSTSNYPLMGGKSFCYEAGMRVPLIIKWPAQIEAGRHDATRTISMDLLPTWLAMAGADAPSDVTLDGQDLLPLLTEGAALPDRPIFFHHPHYTHAAGPFSSVIFEDWKLIRFYNDTSGAEQLFDMANDPYEQNDLTAAQPDRAGQLRGLLDEWLTEVDAERPRPNAKFDAASPATHDMQFTWAMALRERAEHERKWRASAAGRS